MAKLLLRLGVFSAAHFRTVIGAWILLLLLGGGAYTLWHGELSDAVTIPGIKTEETTAELRAKIPSFGGGSGTVVLSTTGGSAFTDEQKAAISALVETARTLPDVSGAVDPFATEAQRAEAARQIEEGGAALEAGRAQLEDGQRQLDAGRAQAQALNMLAQAQARLDEGQKQLDESRAELETQAARLETGRGLIALSAGIRTVSESGNVAMVPVQLAKNSFEVAPEAKQAIIRHFTEADIAGVQADVSTELAQEIPDIIGPGEIIGLIFAGIVLLVLLGSLTAAALPIASAIVGVGVAITSTLALSGVVEMMSVTPVLGVMLGLAVGIDYSLFLLNRHRKQLANGMPLHASIGLAAGTAGNAVLFAGTTVIIALAALNLTGVGFLGLMGTVAAVSVAVAVAIALTLTPALLALVGERVLSPRIRARLTRAAAPVVPMKTGAAVAIAAIAMVGLAIIAIPTASMRLGLPDGVSQPADSTQYRAYRTIETAFGAGVNGPLVVTARLPADVTDVEATQLEVGRLIAAEAGIAAVVPIAVSDDRELMAFQVVPEEGPNSALTAELVEKLRGISANGSPLGVAGQATANIDVSEKLAEALPSYIGVVVGLSLLIMIMVFRSLLVPLIATGGFILSLLATYGASVAIYQWGWMGAVFDVHAPGPLVSFLPIILVGVLFGLAMDYQLFLASGMREAHVHGLDARTAVMAGLRSNRSVVIAAALIMTAVFGGFVFAESAMIRPIGFGLAFGVAIDAFVVRLLLVPALMHLSGEAAWWLPRWLDRILPDVDVEGASLERSHTGSLPDGKVTHQG